VAWITLENLAQLVKINIDSFSRPQIIFKHSTRCSISGMIKNRLAKTEVPADVDFYYLDLINYRLISNKIAESYGIRHQSPQVLVIKIGKCAYSESHQAIYMEDILCQAK
jgi:bacillithiol system protein YtxJ